MIYLWPQASSMVGMHDNFGVIATPAMGGIPRGIIEGRWWACDNGAFTGKFEAGKFLGYLDSLRPWADRCLFVVVPDVWSDMASTLALYDYWAGILAADWPIALSAQPGLEKIHDWPEGFDWLFIGGTDKWRAGKNVKKCILKAKALGALVHIGRVNSIKRFQYFQKLGADSADGTTAIFSPNVARRVLTTAVAQADFVRHLNDKLF